MGVINSTTMDYVVRKNTAEGSPTENRWYGYVRHRGCLSSRGLADHMVEHGLLSNRAEVLDMLSKFQECIPELLAQGYSVELKGFGRFVPTIENTKGGAATLKDFSATKNIKGVHIRFIPDSTDLDALTAKASGRKVSWGDGYYQDDKGRKAPYKPIVRP